MVDEIAVATRQIVLGDSRQIASSAALAQADGGRDRALPGDAVGGCPFREWRGANARRRAVGRLLVLRNVSADVLPFWAFSVIVVLLIRSAFPQVRDEGAIDLARVRAFETDVIANGDSNRPMAK